MPLDEPVWWYGPPGDPRARWLRPIAAIWGAVADRRMAYAPRHHAHVPVICIGNFTAGGTGKTPLSLAIAERLITRGLAPAFLTRGYGGRRKRPSWVEPLIDRAGDVGDEPMLLARVAPVLIAADRAAGARLIEQYKPPIDVIVMDDGLQNPALVKDLRIAVVDGRRGVGNGQVMPAGPLRANLDAQLARADAIVVNQPLAAGEPGTGEPLLAWLPARFPGPVLTARAGPAGDSGWLAGRRWLAFAGIANPGRFWELLARLGADVAETRAFPDHHPFAEADALELLRRADDQGMDLITTEKDHVRLIGGPGALGALAERSRTLPIRLQFDMRDDLRLDALIDGVVRLRTTT